MGQAVHISNFAGIEYEEWSSSIANTAMLWMDGEGSEVYVKRRLVPFGEFLPGRDFLNKYTARAALMPRDFIGGANVGRLGVATLQVGLLICFEVADDREGIETATGTSALIVQTNNATYQHRGESEQQLLAAKMRAIEVRRPVFVVSTSGVSAIINPDGSVASSLLQDDVGVISATIQQVSGQTMAMRIRDGLVNVIFLSSFLILTKLLHRRPRVSS